MTYWCGCFFFGVCTNCFWFYHYALITGSLVITFSSTTCIWEDLKRILWQAPRPPHSSVRVQVQPFTRNRRRKALCEERFGNMVGKKREHEATNVKGGKPRAGNHVRSSTHVVLRSDPEKRIVHVGPVGHKAYFLSWSYQVVFLIDFTTSTLLNNDELCTRRSHRWIGLF